ncbi:MAG: ABC transporter substrate-binding protein [Candidatus Competibacteraceae bacterium]|nr:ABC transporter substrate-binding protein [Candidatus Competibacteraceae bacterium]
MANVAQCTNGLIRISKILLLSLLLLSCTEPEPIRVGFVGGTSGRVADLGVAGRNGVLLAIELRNQAGGIAGRTIELISKDDEQNPETAERVTRELIAQGVPAIVGPMTSAMAMIMVPLANQAQVLLMSPTVTTDALTEQDDYFFRVSSSTRKYAAKSASYQLGTLQNRRIAAVYDLSNRSYTESWLNYFHLTFTQGGGELVTKIGFRSGEDTTFLQITRDLLATQPHGILIVANSVDSALLCQQIRKLNASVAIVISEWGATEQLLELGGKAVENVTAAQLFDRNNTEPSYQTFRNAYLKRFGQEPGFAGVTSFDAANVVLDALAAQPEQSLKKTILTTRHFQGIQHSLKFDDFGEAQRDIFITVVREGQFVVVE